MHSQMEDLQSLFEDTAREERAGEDQFKALPIPGYEPHRIGRDAEGRPALLIHPADADSSTFPPPLALERLTVQHGVRCRITPSDATDASQQAYSRFTVVRCVDSDLASYFLHSCKSVVSALGPEPAQLEVTRLVSRLADLFQAAGSSEYSVQGLWAELFVIAESAAPAQVARTWHTAPESLHDFAKGEQRVEVKCTGSDSRTHRFTFEQLHPPSGNLSVVVASVMTSESTNGVSLLRLIEIVHERIGADPDVNLHVDSVVTATLGDRLARSLEMRFDYERAEDTLRFYLADRVPSVSATSIPEAVSSVLFTSDLSEIDSTDAGTLRHAEGLFAAFAG